jgi:hypothetical protein
MEDEINNENSNINIKEFLKNSLISQYNKVKKDPNPEKIEIKYLFYHAIAYFQYLNLLKSNQAIRLYIEYILSDGTKDKYKEKVYYLDGSDHKAKFNIITIPLYFDDLLKDVSKFLMNHKDIAKTITRSGYRDYFRLKHHVLISDITKNAIMEYLMDIQMYHVIALNKYWTLINKEILPNLLEKTQVVETKN